MTRTDGITIVRARSLLPGRGRTAAEGHRARHSPPIDYGIDAIFPGAARIAGHFLPLPGLGTANFQTTGWHYHDCIVQFAWVASGSIEILFEEGRPVRAQAGDILIIPGGAPHMAQRPSSDYATVEFTLPGDFATTDCAPARVASGGGISVASAPHVEMPDGAGAVILRRLRRGDADAPLVAAVDGRAALLVTCGSCSLASDTYPIETLGPFDLFTLAPGESARVVTASSDWKALQLSFPAARGDASREI